MTDCQYTPKDAGVPIQPADLLVKFEQTSWHGVKARAFLDRQGSLTYQIEV